MLRQMNKKYIVLLLALTAAVADLSARTEVAADTVSWKKVDPSQKRKKFDPEEFHKKLEAFITCEARLTEAEARAFFPMFYELKKQQRVYHTKIAQASRRVRKENLSEKECEKILMSVRKWKKQVMELELSYYEKWGKVLPASKIIKVLEADRFFGRKMFNNMVHPRKGGKGPVPSKGR